MQFAKLPYYVDAMEIAGLASNSQHDSQVVAEAYFTAYQALHIDWFVTRINELPMQSHWDRRARHALIGELNRLLRQTMQAVLATDEPITLSEWAEEHEQKLTSIEEQMDSIQQDVVNLSTLSVLLSEMGRVVEAD